MLHEFFNCFPSVLKPISNQSVLFTLIKNRYDYQHDRNNFIVGTKKEYEKKKFESKKNQMNSTSLFLSTLSSSTTLVVATVDVVDVTDSTDFCGVGSPVNGTVEAATRPARVRARFFRPKTLVPPIPTGGLKQNWGCL